MLDNFCDENTVVITCGESKVTRMTFLGELYPFPNIYRGTDRNRVTTFGRHFAKQARSPFDYFSQMPLWKELFQKTLSTALGEDVHLHPIVYAAGVLFNNNKMVTIAQHNGMEYGTSLDAVSRLTPFLEKHGELRQKSVSDLVPHSPKAEELLKINSKL